MAGRARRPELLRLRRELDRGAYVPVYLGIEDYLNTELPPGGGSLLIALAAGFVGGCEEADVPKQKIVARLRDFLDRLEIKGEAGVAASAGPIDLDLKATLRDDESFRAQVKKALESNRKVFKKEMHSFFQEIVSAMPSGKMPVFIVDSIDHYRGRAATFDEVRDSVESVFSTYSSELALPSMHVVYTVPVYAKPAGWEGQTWPVLNVKVQERDGSECREGISLLRQVLARRAPGGDLERLLGGQVDHLICASGGQFRELFRLVSALLVKDGALPVGAADIDQVERHERSHAAVGITEEQWEILRTVRQTGQLRVPRERTAEAWKLQALGYVLCYRNGAVDWYGVQPLLNELLDET